MLEIKSLVKEYGKLKALNNITINIESGNFGLLGPNGAGKTTLMRTITTLLPIESGVITYKNINWKNSEEVKKIIGYLPQKFNGYKYSKVNDFLTYIALMKGVKKEDALKAVTKVLKETDLEDVSGNLISTLSGGMVRRLGIAQALINNPEILVIDEPTAGLDPERRIEFRNLINSIDQRGIRIISTHIVEDIEATCENICILNKGKILFIGSIEEAKEKVKGKVLLGDFSKEELELAKSQVYIINSKNKNKNFRVRFIKKDSSLLNITNEEVTEETLEDAYFYLMGEFGNE